jgi:hypothetical protein
MPKPDHPGKPRPWWRPQFTLVTLLLVMLLCSFLAAAWSGLIRASSDPDPSAMLGFIALSIGLPMGLMILLSLSQPIRQWIERWRQQR